MNPKWTYIYPRKDDRSWKIYFQWRDFKLHLAGKVDDEKWWDKFLFSNAKDVLGEKEWLQFREDFIKIIDHMAQVNKIGEITKFLTPLLVLFTGDN